MNNRKTSEFCVRLLLLVALEVEEVEHLHGAHCDQSERCAEENFVHGSTCEL